VKPILNPLARLVRDLEMAGLAVAFDRGFIAVAPAENLTPDLRQRIAAMRGSLIELIGVHGSALMPLFRDPALSLSDEEKVLLATNAAAIRAEVASRAGREVA
jgi:hypothetical protein